MDLSKLIEWVKLKPRYFFTIAFATGLVLFAPRPLIDQLGAGDFLANNRGWLGLAFLVSFAAWISHGLSRLGESLLGRVREQRWIRAGEKYLETLTPPEKEILRRCVNGNTKTITLDVSSGVHAGLEANRVIFRASIVSQFYTDFDFNVQRWAWDYLMKHPELLH